MDLPFNILAKVDGGVARMADLLVEKLGAKIIYSSELVRHVQFGELLASIVSEGDGLSEVGEHDWNVIIDVHTPEFFERMKVLGVPMALLKDDIWDQALALYDPPADAT